MTSKLIFVATCLLYSFNSIGQVPGYLGKKIFVQADLRVTPTIGQPTASNRGIRNLYGDAPSTIGLNTHWGMRAGYTLSRTGAVVLGVDYLKTGMIANDAVTQTLNPRASTYDLDHHYLFYNLKGITADIGYQIYKLKKGAIAPLGAYLSYHLSACFLTGNIVDKRTQYYDGVTATHARLGIDPHYVDYSVGIEWGKNNIISDRFLLNTAIKLNMPFNILRYVRINTQPSYDSSANGNYEFYNQTLFDNRVADRMISHSLVMIRLGIGILP